MPAPSKAAGEFSAVAELTNKNATSVLNLTTSNASVELAEGEYLVWLEAANSGVTVYFKLAAAAGDFTLPSHGGGPQVGVSSFRGDTVERVLVGADGKVLNAKLRAGTATLVLQKLV